MAILSKKKTYSKIYHLGYQFVETTIAYNSYLLKAGDTFVLFDLPPTSKMSALMSEIRKIVSLEKIAYLVISNNTISLINCINYLHNEGFKGTIVSNYYYSRQIVNAGITLPMYVIEQHDQRLILNEDLVLEFYPMAFLPYPQMFFTYYPKLETMLSSTLFSSFYQQNTAITIDSIKKGILALQKILFPSSDYLKQPLKQIDELKISNILPVFGAVIPEAMMHDIIDFVRHNDFFNTYRMQSNGQDAYQVNYYEMFNQMINTLLKHYSKNEIITTFKEASITLDNHTLEVKESSLIGYPLWNTFFEIVFTNLGMEGLYVLEPSIHAITKKYQLEPPAILKAQMSLLLKENERLKAHQQKIDGEMAALQTQVEDAKNAMFKDGVTKLLNQNFFKEQLKKDLSEPLLPGYVRGAFLVSLDQLNDINRKYSKEMGDEALRNLVYVMENFKDDSETMLFKQSGPGIVVYKPNTTVEKLHACAVKMRNVVDNSKAFIERVTVSISLAASSEVASFETVNQQATEMIILLEKRMRQANKMGHAAIVDETSFIENEFEGVVLLIDEDEINRNMLQRIFARINLDVKVAKDVEEALRLISTTNIDLIISEINLSKMDGFALKRQLNETKEYRQIPFIMVSHSKTVENIRRGNLLDVDVILEKPIIPEELLGFVKRFRERKNTL